MIIPLAFLIIDKPLLYKRMVFSGRVIQTTVPKDPQGVPQLSHWNLEGVDVLQEPKTLEFP